MGIITDALLMRAITTIAIAQLRHCPTTVVTTEWADILEDIQAIRATTAITPATTVTTLVAVMEWAAFQSVDPTVAGRFHAAVPTVAEHFLAVDRMAGGASRFTSGDKSLGERSVAFKWETVSLLLAIKPRELSVSQTTDLPFYK